MYFNQFQSQQVYCVRNRQGSIQEGSQVNFVPFLVFYSFRVCCIHVNFFFFHLYLLCGFLHQKILIQLEILACMKPWKQNSYYLYLLIILLILRKSKINSFNSDVALFNSSYSFSSDVMPYKCENFFKDGRV